MGLLGLAMLTTLGRLSLSAVYRILVTGERELCNMAGPKKHLSIEETSTWLYFDE